MNWLDIVIIVPCIWFCYLGFKEGFVKSITGLIALILGIWISIRFSDAVLTFCFKTFPKLQEHAEGLSPQLIKIIAFVAVFVLSIIIINLIGKLIDKLVSMVALSPINKIAGGFFGIFKGLLILGVLVYILNIFNIVNLIIKENIRNESFLYSHVESIVPILSDTFKKTKVSFDKNDTFVYLFENQQN